MDIRKSVYELSFAEREAYVQAVLKLKREPSPISGRTYDTYVKHHQESWFFNPVPTPDGKTSYSSYAHGCPGFFPWHRPFLRFLELDLQAVSGNPDITIPYWDWARDAARIKNGVDPEKMPIWCSGFMGGNGVKENNWRVKTGPFSWRSGRWEITIRSPRDIDPADSEWDYPAEPDQDLRRQFGGYYYGKEYPLPDLEKVQNALEYTSFDSHPWNYGSNGFRHALEGPCHNRGHVWVGWNMLPWTSPNDPCFFIHHSNVDRCWAKWQDLHPDQSYLPLSPIPGLQGQGIDEQMTPWDVTPRSVLDYRKMGYAYDGRASDDNPDLIEQDAAKDAETPGNETEFLVSGMYKRDR